MAPIQRHDSPFLLLPPEIRTLIYEYLLPPSFDNDMLIETWEAPSLLVKCPPTALRRTKYTTYDRRKPFNAPAYVTTYRATRVYLDEDEKMYPEIMAVNRQINNETSQFLYGDRCFHFRHHLNALQAFVEDLRPDTRELLQRVSLDLTLPGCPHKKAGMYDNSDFWLNTSEALQSLPCLRGLAISLTGTGSSASTTLTTPASQPDSIKATPPMPKPTVEIFNYLFYMGDESVYWMRELFLLESLEHLVIEPKIVRDDRVQRAGTSGRANSYAQISGHMDTTMIEFLRAQGVPARVMTKKERRPRIAGGALGVPRLSIRPIDF